MYVVELIVLATQVLPEYSELQQENILGLLDLNSVDGEPVVAERVAGGPPVDVDVERFADFWVDQIRFLGQILFVHRRNGQLMLSKRAC